MSQTTLEKRRNFIRQIIEEDLASGKHGGKVITRFPPEPNGYLHIGHAKSICLNFGLANEYSGTCHLRFDDTNPIKEEQEFVDAIEKDVKWLGFDWGKNLFHASDYFSKLYEYAVDLIKQGKAYVDSLSMDEIRQYRGTLQQPGKESPDRNRPIDESVDLLARMKAGEFPDGKYVLRAKIDMNSPNLNMRDPIMYRIRHASHQRTADEWCIYPMYDFAHSLSDALENITHSLCTLEFQDHRPLYDWFVANCTTPGKPQQIEFSRLNLSHTVTSKRKLKSLVDDKHVSSWNDPRMPTLVGMRRRGYPPAAIRNFCELIGISKSDSIIDMSVFEESVRAELNTHAPRAMCVLNPLKIVIENYPEDRVENLTVANHPQNEALGTRIMPFTREIYIEQEDFMEVPANKFFRLAPGAEVRLRSSYVIKCNEVIKDHTGKIIELCCSYDPDTLGKNPEGRKVKGVIHWVSAAQAKKVEVRLYDRLFKTENPGAKENFTEDLNVNSLTILKECYLEPGLTNLIPEQAYQFERLGYFCVDNQDSQKDHLVFNRIVDLRDSWAKS
ncbi:MAG: glutamine--tRNA ligase/YqeY domain fusion protein [Gammaproteobacteria bacterium]